jgi:hypothetical protein
MQFISFSFLPPPWRKMFSFILVLLLGVTVLAGAANGFFPGKPPEETPSGTKPGGGGESPPGGGGPPPWTPAPGGETPGGVTTGGGGGGNNAIPEMDPGAIAGALALLICGSLMLTDRRLRK